MRITAAHSEFLGLQEHFDEYDWLSSPFDTMFHETRSKKIRVQFAGGEFTLENGHKVFTHERLEYRPAFDEEHEAKFREWHNIPSSAEPVRVEKKNELIKASGYDVYRWTWIVICTGRDITLEEKFISEMRSAHNV